MSGKEIAITMGDPGGIGPEVIWKALRLLPPEDQRDIVIIGKKAVMEDALALAGLEIWGGVSIEEPESLKAMDRAVFKTRGRPTAEGGRAAYECIHAALNGCIEGRFSAMVTAPISKEALHSAGYNWPGHTEMLAELTGTKSYGMMLAGGPLRVMLVTTHLPLSEVPRRLSEEGVYEKIILARRGAEMLGMRNPGIGVSGLNPHAGEAGLFGDEEERIILPAVQRARAEGVDVTGPLPPDVIFRKAYLGELDIVVAMYHDQGLIPLKMIAFDKGVNITVGLPVVRVSPDHGTAYDIAWKGLADPSSMLEAIKTAKGIVWRARAGE